MGETLLPRGLRRHGWTDEAAHNPHPGREDDALAPRHPCPASRVAAENALRDSGGETPEPSAEPLQDPWHLHVDGSLARRLGFQSR